MMMLIYLLLKKLIMLKKEFERDILKAVYLKTWSCLSDLYESHKSKKKRYATLREEMYYDLLETAGLAEKDSAHCYVITKKGMEYVKEI